MRDCFAQDCFGVVRTALLLWGTVSLQQHCVPLSAVASQGDRNGVFWYGPPTRLCTCQHLIDVYIPQDLTDAGEPLAAATSKP